MAVLFGTISVLVLARTVRRMFRSDLLGTLAGFLLAIDGLAIVMSRTVDARHLPDGLRPVRLRVPRHRPGQGPGRLLDWSMEAWTSDGAVRPPSRHELGPWLGARPWRLTAAFFLGCACATKWSGVYYLVGFAIMSLLWDRSARRAAGIEEPTCGEHRLGLVDERRSRSSPSPLVTYVASYTGWFVTRGGYQRTWAETAGVHTNYPWIPDVVRSFWHWHAITLNYHDHLFSPHAYEAGPGKWILMIRPTQMYAVYPKCPSNPAVDCARDIVSLGNPILWWTACAALLWCVWLFATRWDWRAGAALMGMAAGWLPVVREPPAHDVHDVRDHLPALHRAGTRDRSRRRDRATIRIRGETHLGRRARGELGAGGAGDQLHPLSHLDG